MSRSKQTSKGRGRSRVVTALGIAGALSLTGGASASNSATQNTAPVILAEEEISDISLATFHVFDKERAGIHRPRARLAMGVGGCGCGCAGCGCACGIGLYYHYTPPVLGEPVYPPPPPSRPIRPAHKSKSHHATR